MSRWSIHFNCLCNCTSHLLTELTFPAGDTGYSRYGVADGLEVPAQRQHPVRGARVQRGRTRRAAQIRAPQQLHGERAAKVL